MSAFTPNITASVDDLDEFERAYIECALWSSCDVDGESLDQGRDASDVHPDTVRVMKTDCADFRRANSALIEAVGATDAQNGHDFWLTRNHHGAGFWDRGYGVVRDELTRAAHAYGSVDLYVGDDGFVHAV